MLSLMIGIILNKKGKKMNEDFYNGVHSELASEIGQKAVIIATLQTQVKGYREYTQKLEKDQEELQKAKDELQANFEELQKAKDELQANFEELQKEKEELQNQLNELKVEGAE